MLSKFDPIRLKSEQWTTISTKTHIFEYFIGMRLKTRYYHFLCTWFRILSHVACSKTYFFVKKLIFLLKNSLTRATLYKIVVISTDFAPKFLQNVLKAQITATFFKNSNIFSQKL